MEREKEKDISELTGSIPGVKLELKWEYKTKMEHYTLPLE
jgi:hypothetical protein